ncbi:hypothetical protein [Bacteroides sp.]|uniref:hypothetical protein n=1 Tax=Bacteroides sp. TaxID=29523 RepID=UPI00261599C6|nr:hypothetical protein [Bacteroides sp.]MDD3039610.1 hypothetical protein [Bacteroides sp.]
MKILSGAIVKLTGVQQGYEDALFELVKSSDLWSLQCICGHCCFVVAAFYDVGTRPKVCYQNIPELNAYNIHIEESIRDAAELLDIPAPEMETSILYAVFDDNFTRAEQIYEHVLRGD